MGIKRQPNKKRRKDLRNRKQKPSISLGGNQRFEQLEDRVLLAVDFVPLPLGGIGTNRADQAIGLTAPSTQPAIALDPNDPGTIAVANESELVLSNNAGNTFNASGNFQSLLGNSATAGGSSELVYTADGELKWSAIRVAGDGTQSVGVTISQSSPPTFGVAAVPSANGAVVARPIIAADTNSASDSAFAGRLYVAFTDESTDRVLLSRSEDGGLVWSSPIVVSAAAETTQGNLPAVTPADVAIGPNGDVYVAYHYQSGATPIQGADGRSNSDGSSGQIFVRRSTDGGETFVSKTNAFEPGEADVSLNVQTVSGAIPRARFSNQGGRQPTVLVDPVREGHVYVVASDDPDNTHGSGDEGNIVFARSTDFGQTWARRTLDVGNGFQVMPQAEIDPFGNIVLAWYDSQLGLLQGDADYRLHVFASYSVDGGSEWANPFQVTDTTNPTDPVTPGTEIVYGGADLDSDNRVEDDGDETYSLGDYFGVESFGGTGYVVWNGNVRTIGLPSANQVFFDVFPIFGTLHVTGLDTDDTFLVRAMPDNSEYIEVFVNGQREYAGLMESLTGGIQFDGLAGNDTLVVDYLAGNADPVPPGGIFFQGNIPEGGQDVGDTLNILSDNRSVDFQNEPSDLDAGLFVIGDSAPISFDSVERTQIDATDYLRPDTFEMNDSFVTASVLGSEPAVTLRDLTIHSLGQSQSSDDFYRITAHHTGMLIINAAFDEVAGDLDVSVLDSRGLVVSSTQDGGRIVIPVVSQESYTVRINGVNGATNTYALELENFAAPAPQSIFIDPNNDTGMMSDDRLTANVSPRFTIQADLTSLSSQGIAILDKEQAEARNLPGAAVFVQILDGDTGEVVDSGYASPVGGDVYSYDAQDLPDGKLIVSSAVHIFDSRSILPPNATTPVLDPVVGPSFNSSAILIQIDTQSPEITSPQLLASSDSGMSRSDSVTNIMQPAFSGVTEANAKVRVLANGNLVGETVAGSDGRWEITVEPLTEGIYDITSTAQDLAGNFGESDIVNRIEIDKTAPNTPYLDLTSGSDTGLSDTDDVTGDNTLTFTMTTTDLNTDEHLNEFNFKYRLYARPQEGTEILIYNSVEDDTIQAANLSGGFTNLEMLTATLPELPDGVHNFKLEVEDRAGNISHDFLLPVEIDTTLPGPLTLDLLSDSDTGMDDSDNVTGFSQPSFAGTGVIGARVNLFAGDQLIGSGTVGGDASDGAAGNGLGAWQITSGSLDDGVYSITAVTETNAGQTTSELLTIEVDTLQPNTPLLDLVPTSDAGHSDTDNITNAITPTFNFATQDPNQDLHSDEFNYKYRLFVRLENGAEELVYDSVGDPLFPNSATDGVFTNLENMRRTLERSLPTGTHNFKLEVEDRAGNISEDFLLDVTVDTTLLAPDDGITLDLISVADTGMDGRDDVTKINTPAFAGVAEVGSEVSLFAGGILVGTTTVGSDDTDFNPGDGLGAWEISSDALRDGQHEMIVHVEDWAGNFVRSEPLTIDVDTTAPNTPFLDLVGGRNAGLGVEVSISNDLTFTMTTEDPDIDDRLSPFNYKFRIFQRAEGLAEELIYSSVEDADIDAANRSGGFTDLTFLQTTIENLPEGQHNFKLEVEDRAGNISQDFLLTVVRITEQPIDAISIDLLTSSDTGMSENDDVTNKDRPGFTGVATIGTEVRLISISDAGEEVIGRGTVSGDGSNGVLGDNLGVWEIDANQLDDGVYLVAAEIEDDFGNTVRTDSIQIEVDTIAPNTPQLDLIPADDTGLSDQDNVTSELIPNFHMATLDSNKETHISPFNFKYRLFVRLDSGVERLVYNSAEDGSFPASAIEDGFISLENLRREIDLGIPDGVHNFKLEVEDRAGNISEDYLLNVTIDTVLGAPDGVVSVDLGAASDTGMSDRDNVTKINTPTFSGIAEVGATVSIIANGQLIGTGTVGSDETDFAPGDGFGQWEVTVQPLDDGQYEVLTHIEDLAGNFLRSEELTVEIDTTQPNTPLLDLLDDSGHSDHDNITDSASPGFNLTTTDPALPDGATRTSDFNLKYRVYQRLAGGEESLLYNSVVDSDIDVNNILEGFTDLNQLQTALGPFPDGTHNLKLEVEDRAGNISEDFLLTFQVDTTLDGDPTVDLIASSDSGMMDDDNVTGVNQPTFTGIAEVGSTVRLIANGQLVGVAEVQSDLSDGTDGDGLGQWEVASQTLIDGSYEISASIEDWAGNVETTAAITVEIDTVEPNTPLLDLLNDTGHSDHDNFTGESSLEFNLTTEDGGSHANEFNLKYRVFLRPEGGEEVLAYDSSTDLSIAGENGLTNLNQLTSTLGPYPDGTHNFKLEVEDRAGNISHDYLLDVSIDSQIPGATLDLLSASDSGMSNTDNVTGINQPAFSGVGEVGSAVRLFANGELVGIGEVQSDASNGTLGDGLGIWEITSEPLDDDMYAISAQVEDWAGNVATTDTLTIEIDTIAPNTPQLDLLPADDTGLSDQDNVTSQLLPVFNMATLDSNKEGHITPFNFKYRLFVRLDSGVERLVYNSAEDGSFPNSAVQDGFISLENLRREIDLGVPDGVHNFKLEVEDRAGNISVDTVLDVVVDTVLDTVDPLNPAVAIDLIAGADTGMSDRDNVTRINNPTFAGIGEVGAMVSLFANGQLVGTGIVGSDETDFNPNDGLGSWEVTVDSLDDGQYDVLAHVEDLAGNFLRSESLQLEIDTTQPNTPYLDLLNDTGHADYDNITEPSELDFNLTTTDPALPDGSDRISDFNLKFRVYARLAGGEEMLAYNSVVDAGIDPANILEGFTDLSQLQATLGPFPDGVHNFKLEVEDRAGNISEDFLLTVEIDSQLDGTTPDIDMLSLSDSGMSETDNVTGIDQPAFTGVAEVGSTVRLMANGQLVGVAEVQSDLSDGTPGDGLGQWEITSEPLDDGTYEIQADVEDWAGNIESSEILQIEVDTLQPNTPLLDLIPSSDSGLSESDNVTNSVNPTFNMATIDPNKDNHLSQFNYKYRLFIRHDSGVELLVYNSAADGSSFTPSAFQDGFTSLENLRRTIALGVPDGVHNFKLEVEDRAGNISEDFLLDVKIDTVLEAPDETITIDMLSTSDTGMSEEDNVTNKDQPALSGIAEVGSIVTILANGKVVGTAVVGSDETDLSPGDGFGAWEVTVEPLDDGIHALTAHVEDLAGNFLRSEELTIEIDTLAPNTPFLDLVSESDTGLVGRDEVTADNTLTFNMTTTDAGPEGHLIDENFKFRLYVRPENGREVLIYNSVTDGELPPEAFRDGLIDLDFLQRTLGELPDGTHNFKLEVEDRAGNISEDFLLNVTIDTSLVTPTIDLINSSDTGMSDSDNVTRKDELAFAGTGDVGDVVSLFANGVLVGTGVVGSDNTDFVPGDGRGAWQVTTEPLDDGVYSIIAHVEDLAGTFERTTPIEVEVDTFEPNTPHLDLVTSSDTGHSVHDNITSDSTPTFTFTTEDPNSADHLNEFNLKYRLFLRPEGGEEVLVYNSVNDPTIATANIQGGFVNLGFLERTLPELPDGIHNFKLEVEDRAGNISHDVVLTVEIDTTLPTGDINLLELSDTGMSSTDNVTNKDEPAFAGVGTAGTLARLFANGQLVGTSEVGSDESDGVIGNGLGIWEITSEPLDDDVYTMTATFEDWAGQISTTDSLQIEVDTLQPNTPFLDLLEPDDSGRHDDDAITNALVLNFSATTEDPNNNNHLVLFPGGENLKYRIFVRPEDGTEVLVYDSVTDPSLLGKVDGFVSLNRLTADVSNVPEGLHNFKLEVEDRAGNISEDFLTNVLVDRTAFQGTVGLHPNSDTGIWGITSTFGDGITGNSIPTFAGTGEANNIVTLLVDGQVAGTTVIKPFDGDNAFTTGSWELTSAILLSDGLHTVNVTFEDPAGNQTASNDIDLVVDTTGPRIVNVTRSDLGFTSIFDPKPAGGPDPLIDSIVVHFSDLPNRIASNPYDAVLEQLALEEGNYRLIGDANGNIPIVDAQILGRDIDGPGAGTTSVQLFFAAPLPDDRFTFTVFDRIADPAGNPLDGDSGANGPFEGNDALNPTSPIFPTGDGNHGGDFIARFTIDSRPEIGVWSGGSVYIDTNGNFLFDPTNEDFVNRDITYAVGFSSDDIFAGNFAGPDGTTDGYDKLAAYGRYGGWVGGTFRWLVDLDNDGVVDIDVEDPADVNGLPVAGNFDGNATNGDEVGLYTGSVWHFDTNGDYMVDLAVPSALSGYPVVGDFDRDGHDDLATWADDVFTVDLANGVANGWDGAADASFRFGFIGVRERPVAADMDQDGFDDLGLWVPDRGGMTPRESGEWYWLVSGGNSVLDRVVAQTDPVRGGTQEIQFRPIPFGDDIFAQFGDQFGIPVVGNFDPPTLGSTVVTRRHTNLVNPLDVTNDGTVSPRDVLAAVTHMNDHGASSVDKLSDDLEFYLDTNGDGFFSPSDILGIISHLNRDEAAGEPDAIDAFAAEVAAAQFNVDEDDDDKEDNRFI